MNFDFKDKKITIMGLGLHGGGLGVTQWLAKQGACLLVTDLKSKKELVESIRKLKSFKIKYVLGRHRRQDFKNIDLVIKNPGVPRNSKYLKIARKNKIPIETDISLFWQMCPAPIIGITGTKGKSTVTQLLGDILKKKNKRTVVAGNIRLSPLNFLGQIKKTTPVVLELSSWQLEDMRHLKKSPHLAILTNLLPDHLNRYRGMQDYVAAKKLIFQFQKKDDYVILNFDCPLTRKLRKEVVSRRFWFSKKFFPEQNGSFIKKGWLVFRNQGREIRVVRVEEFKILGQHNLENILTVVTGAKILRVNNNLICRSLQNFRGLEHRLELVKEFKGVKYVNDTAATNPEAAMAGINTFASLGRVILIAGGTDKNLDFRKLAGVIKNKTKAVILLPGTATLKIKKLLPSSSKKLPMILVKNMKEAIREASRLSTQGDIVLLSPGCASFGLFKNEFERGEKFIQEVKNLK